MIRFPLVEGAGVKTFSGKLIERGIKPDNSFRATYYQLMEVYKKAKLELSTNLTTTQEWLGGKVDG